MQSEKLEILEALRNNVQSVRDSDSSSVELTEELNSIEADLEEAIKKEKEEKQIELLEKSIKEEMQKKLNEAFAKDDSHTKRLSQNWSKALTLLFISRMINHVYL